MIRVNIHEAKTHLSRYMSRVQRGEKILICKRNIPIAELRPVEKKNRPVPRIGLAKGEFTVPKEFFDPLPDDLLRAFNGEEP